MFPRLFYSFRTFIGGVQFAVTGFLCLALQLQISIAGAEQRELGEGTSDKVDAVVVMDASGSMLATDPQRLRDEGAKLFTQFLKPGDRLAIIEFSKDANTIRPLGDYAADQSDDVAADIAKVGTAGTFTDLQVGLKAAVDLLHSNPRDGAKPVVVLLSDGKMDPDPALGSATLKTDALLNELLPEAKAQGIRIHTIAFSDQADKDLLQQIAVASDGVNFFAPTAEEIHSAFAELFLAVKKPQVLPLTSKGFKIDAAIDEATFYINREDAAGDIVVRSPTGQTYSATTKSDAVRWFKGQKFDVVTVLQPEVGDWTLEGLPSGDSFATVLTNLKLVNEWPAAVYEGTPVLLQARLYESDKPVELPEMTGSIKYAVRITPTDRISEPVVKEYLSDDGTNGDAIANDGIYSLSVKLEQPGEYKMVLIAKAPTFERTQQIPFRVRERMVSLHLMSGGTEDHGDAHAGEEHGDEHGASDDSHDEHDAHDAAHDEHGDTESAPGEGRFVVTLSEEAERLKNIEVKLTAVDNERKRYNLPISETSHPARSYEVSTKLLPHAGEYKLQATLTGEGRKKAHITEVSQEIVYKKEALAGEDEHAVVEVVEHTEAKVPETKTPIWLLVVIITIANGAAAALGVVQLRKIISQSVATMPELPSSASASDAIQYLEQMNARSDFPMTDPIFTDTEMQFKVRGGVNAASSAVATPAAAAPANEGDAAAPAPEAPPAESAAPEAPSSEAAPATEETPAAPEEGAAGETTTDEPKSE